MRETARNTGGRSVIQVSHNRVLQLPSAALGTLRRDLIAALGSERAKAFLLRYGWSLGQTDATTLRALDPNMSDQEWLAAGPRMHTKAGMVRVKTEQLVIDREKGIVHVEGVWEDSYEALEHVRYFGRSDSPVCWTLVGYAGGYTSVVFGRRVLYKEVSCIAQGDPVCRFVGMPVDAWGVRILRDLPLYEQESLEEELEAAHRRIRQQNDQLQQVVAVHDELSRALLDGGGLGHLAEAVGRLLGTWVSVEDQRLRPLAVYPPEGPGSAPPLRLGTLVERTPRLWERLSRLGEGRRGLVIPAEPDRPGGELVVAPILSGQELLGFVTMAVVPGLSPALTRMVVERVALACGLELLKQRTAFEVEQRLRGNFLDNLLTTGMDRDFLCRWASHLGLALGETGHRFFLVQPCVSPTSDGEGRLTSLQDRLQRIVQEAVAEAGVHALVVVRGGGVVALADAAEQERVNALTERILARTKKARTPVWIGVSRPFRGPESAPETYEECRSLLGAVREGRTGGPVVQVDRTGAMQLLSKVASRGELTRFAEELLGPLERYDRSHGSDLVRTLHLYLQLEGNLQQTAQKLNISISGLKYRLQRIEEVGGLNLDSPDQRFDLMLALRIRFLGAHFRTP